MKIVNPVGKKLDQGAIFCCAIASDYPQADVHGLIITARCDLANEKAKKYNYIPLVRMEDWLIIDGFPILKSRLFNSILGQVLSSLESVGLYKSFTKNISLAGLAEAIEKIEFSKKKDKVSLLDSIHKLQKMEVISEKNEIVDFINSYPKQISSIIDEIASSKNAEFLYIPHIYDGDESAGYVMLLREVHHIPSGLANYIANGDALDISDKHGQCFAGLLDFSFNDVGMVVGVLDSPFVEFVLQKWAILFTRIGVDLFSNPVPHCAAKIDYLEV